MWFQSWCSDVFYRAAYETTMRIARFAITASFRRILFEKWVKDLTPDLLNCRMNLLASKCLIRFQANYSLFRVFLNTVSCTHTVGLLWKVLKEWHIIWCLYVLHTALTTSFNITVIIVEILIPVTVLPGVPVFVHLSNDDVDRYCKAQCHVTPLTRFSVFTV